MPFLQLQHHQKQLAQYGWRRLLLLSGDKSWQLAQIQKLKETCEGDWLTLSSTLSPAIEPEKAVGLLGREFLHGIFDANDAFNAEALAMLAGTLTAGSWLVLCLPDINQWHQYCDNDSQRWNDAQNASQTPHFMAWLKSITLTNHHVAIWQQSQLLSLPEFQPHFQPWSLPQGEPTLEQQKLLATLLSSSKGIYSITAPRGRGKSALAGMFIEQYTSSVVVCAPAKNSTDIMFTHTNKLVPFYSPDNLLTLCAENKLNADCLIIDEAAALPIAQLISLCGCFSYVIMTTTVQGYEGTGRGFLLKLGDSLPLLQQYQLNTPIRWANDDPLELWLNALLLLDEGDYSQEKQQGEIVITQHQTPWECKPTTLYAFYGLLTSAHYRTTPLDLRRLFDGQKQHYWSASINQNIVGAVWCIEEGEQPETLAQGVWLGTRRPRGNLVAQSLVTYGLTIDAMCLKALRISRIAVLPDYRRQKVAAKLIAQIAQESRENSVDYLSVSFGYTAALAQFWAQCGFHIVRLGIHKEASSGCYTAMAIFPLTTKGDALLQQSLQALSLQYRYIYRQTGVDLSLYLPPVIQSEQWLLIAGFAFAHRPVLTVYDSLEKWLIGYEQDYPLLVDFFIHCRSIEDCVARFSLSGKKALIKKLRQQCAQLMRQKDSRLTEQYQQQLATFSHPD